MSVSMWSEIKVEIMVKANEKIPAGKIRAPGNSIQPGFKIDASKKNKRNGKQDCYTAHEWKVPDALRAT